MIKKFKAWWDRMFPIRTHCQVCGDKLDEPDRTGHCMSCKAW